MNKGMIGRLLFGLIVIIGFILVFSGCTIIRDSHVDLTQAGVINRSADGGSGANDVLNETSGSGGMDMIVPVSALP